MNEKELVVPECAVTIRQSANGTLTIDCEGELSAVTAVGLVESARAIFRLQILQTIPKPSGDKPKSGQKGKK